jgi:predicted dehydrogenase
MRILQLGVDHPHGEMYRTTLAQHDAIELVGAYDPDLDRAWKMLVREGVEIPLFDDMREAIAATVPEAVLITLPNDVTPDAIVLAADHGLHIVAEKPCAVSADAFLPAHERVRDRELCFVPAYLRRFSPVATALRDLIGKGILGELIGAQIHFVTTNVALRNATYLSGGGIERVSTTTQPVVAPVHHEARHWLFDRARSGGGIMHWLGVHWLDLLRFVSGNEFAHVTATLATRTPVPIDVEDVASVTLEARGGLVATVSCAYALRRGPDQVAIAIQGTAGWATWDGVGPELRVQSSHPAWRTAPARTLRFEADPMPGYSGTLGWELFERFRGAVEEGAELPVSATDALRVLELLDAIQMSAREHRRVEVVAVT